IRADTLVNAGTNLLNAGTLQYLSSNGGAGALQNTGTLLFRGGTLVVGTLTNTGVLSGVFTNPSANALTLVNLGGSIANAVVNNGTLLPGSSGDITDTITNLAAA